MASTQTAYRRFRELATAPRTKEMTTRQITMLLALHGHPAGIEVKPLAAEIRVSKPVVTRMANSLQASDLIRRIPHEDDKRRVSIVLTIDGQVLVERLTGLFGDVAFAEVPNG